MKRQVWLGIWCIYDALSGLPSRLGLVQASRVAACVQLTGSQRALAEVLKVPLHMHSMASEGA